jgi:hypothetical protein
MNHQLRDFVFGKAAYIGVIGILISSLYITDISFYLKLTLSAVTILVAILTDLAPRFITLHQRLDWPRTAPLSVQVHQLTELHTESENIVHSQSEQRESSMGTPLIERSLEQWITRQRLQQLMTPDPFFGDLYQPDRKFDPTDDSHSLLAREESGA